MFLVCVAYFECAWVYILFEKAGVIAPLQGKHWLHHFWSVPTLHPLWREIFRKDISLTVYKKKKNSSECVPLPVAEFAQLPLPIYWNGPEEVEKVNDKPKGQVVTNFLINKSLNHGV